MQWLVVLPATLNCGVWNSVGAAVGMGVEPATAGSPSQSKSFVEPILLPAPRHRSPGPERRGLDREMDSTVRVRGRVVKMLIVHVYITLPARLEPSGPEAGLWTGFGQLPAALVEPLLAGVGPLGRRGRRLVLALQQVPDRVDLVPRDRPLRAYRAGDAAVEELPVWKLSYAIDVMLISTQGIACCSTSTW